MYKDRATEKITMSASLKNEFQVKKIRPEHHNPVAFVTSQWQEDIERPSLIYLFIRFSIFITFFVIWLLTITMQTQAGRDHWPIYLTNWGFTLCLLQSFVSFLLLLGAVVDNYMRGKYYWKEKISRMYPLYWVLNVMATTVAFTITLIYWTIIYSAEGRYWSTMNFMVHGFNSILMLFDFWVVSHPVQLLHGIYPVLILLVYATMTAIYYALGGTTANGSPYIYPILKWDQPGSTIGYCIVIMILILIINTLTYCMYKLRAKISPPIRSFIYRKLFSHCNSSYYA